MQLDRPAGVLQLVDLPDPTPRPDETLVRVQCCGVCRTDLHIVDGEITDGRYPIVPGHQIVGEIAARGARANAQVGTRVGICWLGQTCGSCGFCVSGRENLCDTAQFTGYQRPGGFAEYVVADPRFCFAIPEGFDDLQAAPLLCAGLIGYRALSMAADARRLGFYGFGSAAHILTQIAAWQGREVYAFTRDGDTRSQAFARGLGAIWAGSATTPPPEPLDAAIIFAPAGSLVPAALKHVVKGGSVICAGIHMSDIPSFPYADLWGERHIRSVANLTREDGRRLLEIAPQVPIRTQIARYPLDATMTALNDLRSGRIDGSAVIEIASSPAARGSIV
jgi:alcohol dehydrogenase, propanol-preferring